MYHIQGLTWSHLGLNAHSSKLTHIIVPTSLISIGYEIIYDDEAIMLHRS